LASIFLALGSSTGSSPQNSQRRAERAIHQKLDAVADGLADFMEHLGGDQPGVAKDIDNLRRAVGVEKEMVNKHG
jgi:hypothetical protein